MTNRPLSTIISAMNHVLTQREICDQMDTLWDMYESSEYSAALFNKLIVMPDDELLAYPDTNIHEKTMANFVVDYRLQYEKLNQEEGSR